MRKIKISEVDRRLRKLSLVRLSSYSNARTPMKVACRQCNHEWNTLPGNLFNGHGCPDCSKIKAAIKRRKKNETRPVNKSTIRVVLGSDDQSMLINKADYDLLINLGVGAIRANGYGYATFWLKGKNYFVHRFILDAKPGDIVDHKNHDILDNRRSNIRICSSSENSCNHSRHSRNTSGKTGVSFDKGMNKWRSYINKEGKRISLGYFDDIEDAISARKQAEEKYYGEFSYKNSMED